MKKQLLLPKDEYVCKRKPLFDLLQKKELRYMKPIEVTNLLEQPPVKSNSDCPDVYLWNQLSDPNFGIHDFLKIEGEDVAEFKWAVVDGEISSIESLLGNEKEPIEIQLTDVMNKLAETGKFATYFVAEGLYEGKAGTHFCLTPYNDKISCDVLQNLFGSELIEKITNSTDETENIMDLDLGNYFNPDVATECENIFVQHFTETLGLFAMQN
jgi:hypothetical protein